MEVVLVKQQMKKISVVIEVKHSIPWASILFAQRFCGMDALVTQQYSMYYCNLA